MSWDTSGERNVKTVTKMLTSWIQNLQSRGCLGFTYRRDLKKGLTKID